MPNIGPVELIIILVIALIVIGPGRLPDVGAALGKSIREFRKASSDMADATRVDVSPMPTAPQPNTLQANQQANTLQGAPSTPPAPAPVVTPPPADDSTGPTA